METNEVKCEACGVTKIGSKENPLFRTRMCEISDVKPMTPEAFYAKCCVHAKKPGCINQIESEAKPEDFDKFHKKVFGTGTDDFVNMARELIENLPNDSSEN